MNMKHLINKKCKIVYRESTAGSNTRIIFCYLRSADEQFISVEFLRDNEIKIISSGLIETITPLKGEFENEKRQQYKTY